jgi:DNA-binding Lrp family transcriptional regulator
MVDQKGAELTLYVQSKKVITSFYRPPASAVHGAAELGVGADVRMSGHSDEDSAGAGEEHYFLSDDQARAVALAEEVAQARGYTIKVVDVGKAGIVERIVVERLRGVQKFPVLVGPGKRRLEGPEAFNVDDLAELMPTELKRLRAYTYIKVKGGDLDRVREALLEFAEARELHLLTGDWDVFVVLEFPQNSRKRQILDFITERIRGIPNVLDTSTLVPEYTVTKMPIALRTPPTPTS